LHEAVGGVQVSDLFLQALAAEVQLFDLGRPMFVGMPQSPNHPTFWHTLPRRHGDMVRADGGSAANDMIVTGTHVGTHIDALAHVSQDGRLHGGGDASSAAVGGRFMDLGVHTVPPLLRRGILLDVPKVLGVASCEPGYEISPDDLEAAQKAAGVEAREGDVVLVRSGWGERFEQGQAAYVGVDSGVPGVGEAGAQWLASTGAVATGADTIAFERLTPGKGHAVLPAHRVLLVDAGIYILEALDLDELAAAGCAEFTFIGIPLKLVGATGSPIRPLAVTAGAGVGK